MSIARRDCRRDSRSVRLSRTVESKLIHAGLFITLPGVHFEPELLVRSVPHSFAYLGISALVSQAIILVLTLLRFLRGQWAGTSLGTLLVRDGSIVYLIFFVTTLAAVVYSIRSLPFGMAEYAWYLSIVSSVVSDSSFSET